MGYTWECLQAELQVSQSLFQLVCLGKADAPTS